MIHYSHDIIRFHLQSIDRYQLLIKINLILDLLWSVKPWRKTFEKPLCFPGFEKASIKYWFYGNNVLPLDKLVNNGFQPYWFCEMKGEIPYNLALCDKSAIVNLEYQISDFGFPELKHVFFVSEVRIVTSFNRSWRSTHDCSFCPSVRGSRGGTFGVLGEKDYLSSEKIQNWR